MAERGHRRFPGLDEDAAYGSLCIPRHQTISAAASSQPAMGDVLAANQRALGSSKMEVHQLPSLWEGSLPPSSGSTGTSLERPPPKARRRQTLLMLSPKGCIWACLVCCTRSRVGHSPFPWWRWLRRAKRQPGTSPAGMEEMNLGLREDREPQLSSPPCCVAGLVPLRLSPPSGLSSVPP